MKKSLTLWNCILIYLSCLRLGHVKLFTTIGAHILTPRGNPFFNL